MKSYEAARGLFSFMSFCAWAVIVLGAIVGLLGASATQSFGGSPNPAQAVLGALPGILMALAGLLGLAIVQMGRASVDTAEYAQQSLKVSRDHLSLSRQMLEHNRSSPATFASADATPAPAQRASKQTPYAARSYAEQPSASTPVIEQELTPPEAPEIATDTATPAIAAPTEADVPLPADFFDIVYKDGLFAVGGETFQTKGLAMDHQAELEDNRRST